MWYQWKIEAVVSAIHDDAFPETLDLRKQSAFTLGYYQMGALLTKERKEAQIRKQENAAQKQPEGAQSPVFDDSDAQMSMEQYSGMTGN